MWRKKRGLCLDEEEGLLEGGLAVMVLLWVLFGRPEKRRGSEGGCSFLWGESWREEEMVMEKWWSSNYGGEFDF